MKFEPSSPLQLEQFESSPGSHLQYYLAPSIICLSLLPINKLKNIISYHIISYHIIHYSSIISQSSIIYHLSVIICHHPPHLIHDMIVSSVISCHHLLAHARALYSAEDDVFAARLVMPMTFSRIAILSGRSTPAKAHPPKKNIITQCERKRIATGFLW